MLKYTFSDKESKKVHIINNLDPLYCSYHKVNSYQVCNFCNIFLDIQIKLKQGKLYSKHLCKSRNLIGIEYRNLLKYMLNN